MAESNDETESPRDDLEQEHCRDAPEVTESNPRPEMTVNPFRHCVSSWGC